MSKESVLKVRETEAEAQKIVEDANARAKQMIVDAEYEAKRRCDICEAVTRREFAEKVREVRAGANALVEKDKANTDREASKMMRTADANMEVAVDLISRRLVAECQ